MSAAVQVPSARFWDKIAGKYAKRPIADEAAYQRKLQVTREYFTPDMDVLEFGCGTGSTAVLHAPYVKHILAIDISSKMLEIARGKAEADEIANVTFQRSTIDEFTVADESFDAVLGLSILHLLHDKEQVLAKVFKMLKPGGIFVSSTACIADTMKSFKYIAPIGRFFGLVPFVSIFSREELEHSVRNAGFAIDYQWQPGRGKSVFLVAKKAP